MRKAQLVFLESKDFLLVPPKSHGLPEGHEGVTAGQISKSPSAQPQQ